MAVEVYPGNTADPTTLASQIFKVKERWGLERVVWVADRGLLTEARIREELRPMESLELITALRAPAIRKQVHGEVLQLSLFDEQDWPSAIASFQFSSPDYPGERLVACRNPLLAEERARNREDLLRATERELEKVAAATRRQTRRLAGQDKIGLRVGKILGTYKVGKHFNIEITDEGFTYRRNEERIREEARLDAVSVIRTSVTAEEMHADAIVRSYEDLSRVERAFRSLKAVRLEVRPIHHRLERVKTHVFICMLAYYVLWHIRKAVAPLLFDDDDPDGAKAKRRSILAPAQRSARALEKAASKTRTDGHPVHSVETLLRDVATLTKHRMRFDQASFDQVASPTALQ